MYVYCIALDSSNDFYCYKFNATIITSIRVITNFKIDSQILKKVNHGDRHVLCFFRVETREVLLFCYN